MDISGDQSDRSDPFDGTRPETVVRQCSTFKSKHKYFNTSKCKLQTLVTFGMYYYLM